MEHAEQSIRSIQVQVCYAEPEYIFLNSVTVPEGSSVREAIVRSGFLANQTEMDLARLNTMRVGIYGKLKTFDTVVRDHDRIEIYRPLTADPKDMRRRRMQVKIKASG